MDSDDTVQELKHDVWLTKLDDDELVSRLCLAYLENHDNNTEPQVNTFREYRLELMRRLAQRNDTGAEATDE